MNRYRSLGLDELCALISASDHDAFKELFERTWPVLYDISLRKLGDPDLAKEMVQELFIDVWEKRTRRHIVYALPYLKQAIRFKIISYYARHDIPKQDLASVEHLLISPESADDGCFLKDTEGFLQKWLDKLPRKRRRIFELYLFEQRSTKEIGELLEISPKTVRNQLLNGRQKLRLLLEKWLIIFFLVFFGT